MSIIIDENFDGIRFDEEHNEYVFDGDIEGDGDIDVRVNIKITGGIKAGGWIDAGKGIKAGEWIDAGGGIDAGGWIKAGGWIDAGGGIEAGVGIDAGGGIKAGKGVKAGEWIEAGEQINAESVSICGHTGKKIIILNGLLYKINRWGDMIKIGCQTYRVEEWRSFSDRQILEMDGKRGLAFWKEHKDMILGLLPNEHEVKECCETKTN